MSLPLVHSLLGGVPLLVLLIVAALVYSRKGPHASTYKMDETWTHPPILWASEEPADHGHSASLTIGGGASGKW